MQRWILFAIAASVCFAQFRVPAEQPSLNQVLGWLPTDTETVLGANGPFSWATEVPSNDTHPQERMTDAELEMQSRMFPLGLLNFKNRGLGEFVKDKRISFAIEGSRRFRPPSALGIMRYEGCLILVFGPAVSLDGAAFMKAATKSAIRFEESDGVKIAVFEEQAENDTWATFVGFPRANVVVVATNFDYLRTLLRRMLGDRKSVV